MQLYLVRHAQSFNNAHVDHPNQRVPDPPLTELGFAQAKRLAHYLQSAVEPDRASDTLAWRYGNLDTLGYHIDRIITSPMLRALQTAQPLADALNVPVDVWWEICERGGMFEYRQGTAHGYPGLTREQIREQFPHYELPLRVGNNGWWHGGQESRDASRRRAIDVEARLRAQSIEHWRGQRILMVSHAGFLDVLLKSFLLENLTAEADERNVYFFYNTSISRMDFLSTGEIGLRYTNRLPHLPDELIS